MKVVLFGLFSLALTFDMYIVRHGARSPGKQDFHEIFGVGPNELTAAGKSQAYFYGKELHHRHAQIRSEQLKVFSSGRQRTISTAEYFLMGWLGIRRVQNGENFIADPIYLPPCRLSYVPMYANYKVRPEQYKHRIQILPKDYYSGFKCVEQDEYSLVTDYDRELDRKMRSSNLCNKFNKFKEGFCSKRDSPADVMKNFKKMQDLWRCLAFIGKKVPNVTYEEMELPRQAKQNIQIIKATSDDRLAAIVTQPLRHLHELYRQKQYKVVAVFIHDTNQIPLLRLFMGEKAFYEFFREMIAVPFLNSIRININEDTDRFKLFMNDRQIKIHNCADENGQCKYQNLRDIISPYTKPLEQICRNAQNDQDQDGDD